MFALRPHPLPPSVNKCHRTTTSLRLKFWHFKFPTSHDIVTTSTSACLTRAVPVTSSPPGRRKNAGSEPSTSRSCSWWASPSRTCPWGSSCYAPWWKMTWGWWCCCWHTAPRRRLTRPTGTETDAQLCTSPARWPTWSLLSCSSGWVDSQSFWTWKYVGCARYTKITQDQTHLGMAWRTPDILNQHHTTTQI